MTGGINFNNVFDGKTCKMLKDNASNVGEMIKSEEIVPISLFFEGTIMEKAITGIFPGDKEPCEFRLNNDVPVLDRVCEEKKPESLNIDGKIGDFEQGSKGDCWLLSSIKALSRNPKGAEILKNAISQDSCGNVTVTLKGAKDKNGNPVKIEMSSDELYRAKDNLSSGDDDVIAIERAVDKYRRQQLLDVLHNPNMPESDKEAFVKGFDDGSKAIKAMELLTGKHAEDTDPFIDDDKATETYKLVDSRDMKSQIQKAKQSLGDVKSIPTTITFSTSTNDPNPPSNDSFQLGRTELYFDHVYTVTSIEGDYVYLRNPHDSKTPMKVNMKKLFKMANTEMTNAQGSTEAKFYVTFSQVKL